MAMTLKTGLEWFIKKVEAMAESVTREIIMATRYKNYQYSYDIAVYSYGTMSGWVPGETYKTPEEAFDALDRLQKEEPLDAKYGSYYRIDLYYIKDKDETKP